MTPTIHNSNLHQSNMAIFRVCEEVPQSITSWLQQKTSSNQTHIVNQTLKGLFMLILKCVYVEPNNAFLRNWILSKWLRKLKHSGIELQKHCHGWQSIAHNDKCSVSICEQISVIQTTYTICSLQTSKSISFDARISRKLVNDLAMMRYSVSFAILGYSACVQYSSIVFCECFINVHFKTNNSFGLKRLAVFLAH